MKPMRMFLASAPLVLLPFLVSCAHLPLAPMAQEERRPLSVQTADLTGTGADSLFSGELRRALDQDFLHLIEKNRDDLVSSWALAVVPNPFRASTGGDTSGFRFRGELERSDYVPASSVERTLDAYMVFGLLGAALTQGEENAYVAALLYRFSAGAPTGGPPFVVRVARQGDVRRVSRRDLTIAATRDAVRLFLSEAVQRAERDGLPVVPRRRYYLARSEASALKALESLTAGPRK